MQALQADAGGAVRWVRTIRTDAGNAGGCRWMQRDFDDRIPLVSCVYRVALSAVWDVFMCVFFRKYDYTKYKFEWSLVLYALV